MKTRSITILGGLVLIVAAVVGFTLYQSAQQQASTLTRVTVRLKWVHQAQFAGFYVAKEKGYYRDAGLDVDLEPGGSNFPAIQTVVTGGEDFGVTGADQVLLARSKGADVVPLLVIYQQTPFVLFVKKSSPILTFNDIVGKRVGVKLGGNEELTYRAMLIAAGINSSSVDEIPVNVDMSQFFAGKVDVWPGYSINEPIVAEEQGVPVRIFTPDQLGISMYADTLFTVGSKIKRHPDVIRRFVEATKKGWDYAIAHPDEAAKITMEYASNTTLVHQTAMMKASLPSLAPSGSQFGGMTEAGWQSMQQLLLKQHLLDKPVDIGAMLGESELGGAAVK